MMNIKWGSGVYLKGRKNEGILLLDWFTGRVKEMKDVGRRLNEEGFSCYVGNYRGQGVAVREFVG